MILKIHELHRMYKKIFKQNYLQNYGQQSKSTFQNGLKIEIKQNRQLTGLANQAIP